MNVSRRRKRYEPPEAPHFFKIILSDTLQIGKLMIPKRFVAKYGNRLPNQLLLKVAGDANWPVELEKCDDRDFEAEEKRAFLLFFTRLWWQDQRNVLLSSLLCGPTISSTTTCMYLVDL
ncbi:hypothetical protein NL676_013958 [Syzygium grande]|nr:hypothetical protein NL676_013958 [Syzygium grande]